MICGTSALTSSLLQTANLLRNLLYGLARARRQRRWDGESDDLFVNYDDEEIDEELFAVLAVAAID